MDEEGEPFNLNNLPGRISIQQGKKASAVIRFKILSAVEDKWSKVESTPIFDDDGNIRMAVNVFHDITESKKAEELLKLSEKRFRLLVEQSPLSTQIFSPDGKTIRVNKAWEDLFGAKIEDMFSYNILNDQQLVERGIMSYIKKGFSGEADVIPAIKYTPDRGELEGKEVWVSAIIYPVKNDDGSIREIVLIHQDITERKKAKDLLEISLKEKDVLLREIHHRVKNNLQIISSLLNLQSNYIEDEATIEIIKESQHRVKSMALIHEKLYQSEGLSNINFFEYVKELVTNLFNSYYLISRTIISQIEIDNVFLNIDVALSLGLIINELVTNSLKHAFNFSEASFTTGNFKGKVSIILHESKEGIFLTVSDNGTGFPESLNFKKTDSLGLQLVDTLVDQHEGKIELIRNNGSEFRIYFPCKEK